MNRKVDLRGHAILIIDDNPANLGVISNCLEAAGSEIMVAPDGESGLSIARSARPDLILLDILMPGIDGIETCRRLKNDERSRDIPVIFMTALASTEDKVAGFEAGGVDYITKPFQVAEVLARVNTQLTLHAVQKQLKSNNEQLQLEIAVRRKAEEDLRAARAELEHRVEERTAELTKASALLKEEIHERRRTEEDHDRLVTAIEQAGEAIFITDTSWVLLYVNPAFERMTGHSRSEVIGQHARILQSDRHNRAFFRNIRDTLTHGGVWSGRIVAKRKDGSFYDAEVTGSPVRDKTGSIINYVGIHRDITNETRLEKQLRQAQKMEAIGTLAGGIAHDFNNLLTAIVGYSEMACSHVPLESQARHHLDQVLSAGSRATDLVKQILTFSRQTEQERKPVRIAPIIKEVLKLLRSSLPTTIDIRQDFTSSTDGYVVLADVTQVHQVLMNLCANAAHAMRAHGGVLSVSLSEVMVDAFLASRFPDLKPGPYLQLSVCDTGHGMDAAVMERIFDPYFSTKGPGEGTGLGLAVVQGIVKTHDGAINVYSEPGKGTTFNIFLPKNPEEEPSPVDVMEVFPCEGERILFVEDEETLADLGKEMLESLGYRVISETSSIEALRTFRTQPDAFDLVITDMTMPGLTGRDLARELMAIRKDLPIVLCTGLGEMINGLKSNKEGIREFVKKPYRIHDLNKAIRKAMGHETD